MYLKTILSRIFLPKSKYPKNCLFKTQINTIQCQTSLNRVAIRKIFWVATVQKYFKDIQLDESNLKISFRSRPCLDRDWIYFLGRDSEKNLGRDLDRVEVPNTSLYVKALFETTQTLSRRTMQVKLKSYRKMLRQVLKYVSSERVFFLLYLITYILILKQNFQITSNKKLG